MKTQSEPVGRKRRHKGSETIGVYVDFDLPYGRLLKTAKDRKGLGPKQYLQSLIAIGDKQIPNKPKLPSLMFKFQAGAAQKKKTGGSFFSP